jgi:hypothetical protein
VVHAVPKQAAIKASRFKKSEAPRQDVGAFFIDKILRIQAAGAKAELFWRIWRKRWRNSGMLIKHSFIKKWREVIIFWRKQMSFPRYNRKISFTFNIYQAYLPVQ